MEVTWRLRPDVLWHDGTAFSPEDLVFAYRISRTAEIGIFRRAYLDLIDSVQVTDPRTVVVTWRELFIEADTLFGPNLVFPLPRHILEQTYDQDKPNFLGLPYWREEFVGTGPFKMADWVAGSHLVLAANDRYLRGRPKMDEIEVKFIRDLNTIAANVQAGTVEKVIGERLGIEQAIALRDTAPAISVQLAERLGGVVPLYPQHVNPDPPVIGNPEFRRALLQSIGRVEMNDAINGGVGPIAHSWLQPDTVEYQAIEPQVVKYQYDPRRAAEIVEGLGYTRGSDGVLRDPAGRRLVIELRTTDQVQLHTPSILSVAEYFKRLGIDAEVNILPMQRLSEREYVATYPAFHMTTGGQGLESSSLLRWRSTQSPSPANNWSGQNRGRYTNPAFDALVERYGRTIAKPERWQVLGEIIHHQTDVLTHLPLFYQAFGVVLGPKGLKNVTSSQMWHAHLWDY
jgi:peptide/nickel transport system substrate-binding protein